MSAESQNCGVREKKTVLGNGCVTRNNGVTVGRVLRLQLQEQKVGMRWSLACEDVSLGAEERPLLKDVTKQCSEDRV
jgi:hypothetical protein